MTSALAGAGCLYKDGKRAYFAAQEVCAYVREQASRNVEADFLKNIRPSPAIRYREEAKYSMKMLVNMHAE